MITAENQLQIISHHRTLLGEGALWNPIMQILFWVDIEDKKLFSYDPVTKKQLKYDMPAKVSTVVPYDKTKVVLGLQNEIALFDIEQLRFQRLSPLEAHRNDTRANDGKCDPAGRFWIGTMQQDAKAGDANLYCLDHQLQLVCKISHVTISNGIVWSPDHSAMYYIDTPTMEITRFNFDVSKGHISDPATAVKVPEVLGKPDGMTIDSEGMLWVAHFNGGRVIRWNPHTGSALEHIELPVPHVSSCAFGDADLKTLYITTVQHELTPQQIEQYPDSGKLFAVRTSVPGVPFTAFKTQPA